MNKEIDIYNIFWKLNVINYDKQSDGIIKKQIKISCLSHEELDEINIKLKRENCVKCYIINSIDNPNGRVKFKNIQKISIGLSKRDILNARSKQKSAFYNCFVLTIRIYFNDIYREIHVKVFNTGKIEIPGVQNDELFYCAINKTIEYLQCFYEDKLEYNIGKPIVREVKIPEIITVQELANRMASRVADVIKVLIKNEIAATANQSIDADTAELVVLEFGHKSKRISEADIVFSVTNRGFRVINFFILSSFFNLFIALLQSPSVRKPLT